MGKHKHRTLRKRKIHRKKHSTLKYRSLKYKKRQRGGDSPSSPSQTLRESSPSNYSLRGMYSRLKSSLGITPHSISLNKIKKTVLKDIPKEDQDKFIITLKSNLTKWVKDLGNDGSTEDQPLLPDSLSESNPNSNPESNPDSQSNIQSGPKLAPQPESQPEHQPLLHSDQQQADQQDQQDPQVSSQSDLQSEQLLANV